MKAGSVETAEVLVQRGFRPCLLNFAHGYNCGGGFEHAGGSQEEDIFRKSSAFLSLWPHRRTDDGPGVLARGMWIGDFDKALERKTAFYPHSNCGVIYSPHVRLIRQLLVRDSPLLKDCDVETLPKMGLLTCAAQDCMREPPFNCELLRQKIRSVLYVAAMHGHNALVLGAFGCGYFRNPPEIVASVFDELLKNEFSACFRAVLFAVPDAGGPNREAFGQRF